MNWSVTYIFTEKIKFCLYLLRTKKKENWKPWGNNFIFSFRKHVLSDFKKGTEKYTKSDGKQRKLKFIYLFNNHVSELQSFPQN